MAPIKTSIALFECDLPFKCHLLLYERSLSTIKILRSSVPYFRQLLTACSAQWKRRQQQQRRSVQLQMYN